MFKIYDEPESPNDGCLFKIYDDPESRNEGVFLSFKIYGESDMMNSNLQMRGRVQDIGRIRIAK